MSKNTLWKANDYGQKNETPEDLEKPIRTMRLLAVPGELAGLFFVV